MIQPTDDELKLVCDALAIHSNRYVGPTVVWYEYPDMASFCLTSVDSASVRRRVPSVRWKISPSLTGDAQVVPPNDVAVVGIEPDDLRVELAALRKVSEKFRIAVNRWKRSKLPEAQFVDQAIDLRIALEALYAKKTKREGYRESISRRGQLHLGDRDTNKTQVAKILREAYAAASDAVHKGKVADTNQPCVLAARDLCREGILRSLRGNPPAD